MQILLLLLSFSSISRSALNKRSAHCGAKSNGRLSNSSLLQMNTLIQRTPASTNSSSAQAAHAFRSSSSWPFGKGRFEHVSTRRKVRVFTECKAECSAQFHVTMPNVDQYATQDFDCDMCCTRISMCGTSACKHEYSDNFIGLGNNATFAVLRDRLFRELGQTVTDSTDLAMWRQCGSTGLFSPAKDDSALHHPCDPNPSTLSCEQYRAIWSSLHGIRMAPDVSRVCGDRSGVTCPRGTLTDKLFRSAFRLTLVPKLLSCNSESTCALPTGLKGWIAPEIDWEDEHGNYHNSTVSMRDMVQIVETPSGKMVMMMYGMRPASLWRSASARRNTFTTAVFWSTADAMLGSLRPSTLPGYRIDTLPEVAHVWDVLLKTPVAFNLIPADKNHAFVQDSEPPSFGPSDTYGWACFHYTPEVCPSLEPLYFGKLVKSCAYVGGGNEGDSSKFVWLGVIEEDGTRLWSTNTEKGFDGNVEFGDLALEFMRLHSFYVPICGHNFVHFGFQEVICAAEYILQAQSGLELSAAQEATHLHCVDSLTFNSPHTILPRTLWYPRVEPTDSWKIWANHSTLNTDTVGWPVLASVMSKGIAINSARHYQQGLEKHINPGKWLVLDGQNDTGRFSASAELPFYRNVPKYRCLEAIYSAYNKTWQSVRQNASDADREFLRQMFTLLRPYFDQYPEFPVNETEAQREDFMYGVLTMHAFQTSALHSMDHQELYITAERFAHYHSTGWGLKGVPQTSRDAARATFNAFVRFNDGPSLTSDKSSYMLKNGAQWMSTAEGINYHSALMINLREASASSDGQQCLVKVDDIVSSICF